MVLFEKKLTKEQLKEIVKSNWALYRLVFAGFDYNTVFYQMTPREIEMANIALDIKIKQEERALKKR